MLECRFGQFYAPARPPSSPGVFWTNHQQGRRPPTDLTRPLNPRPAARSYLRRLLHCALPYTCSETKYVGQPTEAQSSAFDGRGIGLDGGGLGTERGRRPEKDSKKVNIELHLLHSTPFDPGSRHCGNREKKKKSTQLFRSKIALGSGGNYES